MLTQTLMGMSSVKYPPLVAEGIAWGNVAVFNPLTDAVLGIIVVAVKRTVV